MTGYIVLKEGGEWKLVQSGETADSYVHTSSNDKGDVISLGNEILSNHAMDKDVMAIMVIMKASGSVQAVRVRNADLGAAEVQVYRTDEAPFLRKVELAIHQNEAPPSHSGFEEIVIGYYVTRRAAERAAIHIRKRL